LTSQRLPTKNNWRSLYNILPWAFSLIMIGIIVAPGVSKGLERAAKIMMPLLFLFAIGLLVMTFTWRTPVNQNGIH